MSSRVLLISCVLSATACEGAPDADLGNTRASELEGSARVTRFHATLVDRLGLARREREELRSILAEAEEARRGILEQLATHHGPPPFDELGRSRPDWLVDRETRAAASPAGVQARIRALLGNERYAKYAAMLSAREYEATRAAAFESREANP